MRNLFNQNDDDDIYEGIKYLFDESMMKENGLYYEEIKNLMPVRAKKEYVSVIHGRIEQEEAIEYRVNYCEVNYYEWFCRLMSVRAKEEYVSVIDGRIEKEEAIEYRVN